MAKLQNISDIALTARRKSHICSLAAVSECDRQIGGEGGSLEAQGEGAGGGVVLLPEG